MSLAPIDKSWLFEHPLQKVYGAWVSSDTAIAPAAKMDIHPVVGGHYRLYMSADSSQPDNEGHFSRVEPEQRVTYTWQWAGDSEQTVIDVQFVAEGSGTRVTLTHSGFETERSRENHNMGWDSYASGFAGFLETLT